MPQAPGEGEVQGKMQLIDPLPEPMAHQQPLRVYSSLRKQVKEKNAKHKTHISVSLVSKNKRNKTVQKKKKKPPTPKNDKFVFDLDHLSCKQSSEVLLAAPPEGHTPLPPNPS